MSKSNKKKNTTKPVEERYTLPNSMANLFLLAAFTLFPLFVNLTLVPGFPFISFENGFRAIRHYKYYLFLVLACLFVIIEIMLLVTKSAEEIKEPNPKRRTLTKSLRFTDWAMLALVLSSAVSTLFSPYFDAAFFGEATVGSYTVGRNNGLLLILAYAAVYLALTRCFRYKEYVFTAMAVVSGVIYLLAVLNGFYIDPLRMFVQFEDNPTIYQNFMTTIGNKNMFSSYICVTLPVIICLFVQAGELWRKAVYLAVTAVGAMAVVVCDSDSVVLGLGAFAAVFTVAYAKTPRRLKRLLLSFTVMLLSVKLLRLFALWGGDRYKELTALPSRLMFSNAAFIALGVLAVLTAALYALDWRKPGFRMPKAVPFVLGGVFAAAALAGLGTLVYFSAIDTQSDLGDAARLLRYGDAWGTHRGFMWNKALEAFGGFNVFQKLFGTGPETFYYTFSPYFSELWSRFGDTSTDAAHNEYINYLLNLGIVGLASYLTLAGGALVRAFKAAKRNPLSLVFASAVVAYLAQAVVNIALPIATPLFVIFLSLCEATARRAEKEREAP